MNWISLEKVVKQKIGIAGLGVLEVIWNIK